MKKPDEQLTRLIEKMEDLLKRHQSFSNEINELSAEISILKNKREEEFVEDLLEESGDELEISEEVEAVEEQPVVNIFRPSSESEAFIHSEYSTSESDSSVEKKSDLEKFIGENLINKIGIAITVIGVAIGAKYSIDHDLISPVTRIILGYLMGIGLLGIGIKLKRNYENYSAVLVSGAMAIVYFITYFAYSLYELFPQVVAFSMMVIITAFTVVIAIYYNRQVIAHIGMVGAYAVPFLLSNNSGNVAILFGYMAIINIGILVIAFQKYWKPIYYASFLISWLIYFSWFSDNYHASEHFALALIFLFTFFVTFYVIFLAYKLIQKEKFDVDDVLLLLANSFIFYGIGYSILKSNAAADHLLGIFTFCNALIHFSVGYLIYKRTLADRYLFYLVAGLALVFATISIPVQFDGNWVTLLWAGEAVLLFWIGRTKSIQFYEIFAYILILATFISIVNDWTTVYYIYKSGQSGMRLTPLFNINFLSSLLVIFSFGYINLLYHNKRFPNPVSSQNDIRRLASVLIPFFLLSTLYFSFRIEIATYWNQLYNDSLKVVERFNPDFNESFHNIDLLKFQTIWILNYSLLFVSLLSFVNFKKLRNYTIGLVNLGLSTIAVVVFLFQGLIMLGDLRESYLNHTLSVNYQQTGFNIGIRYVSYFFVGLTLLSVYSYCKEDFMKSVSIILRKWFDCILHISILWIASSELITWMDMMKIAQSDKLGLTIFWGIYALILIGLGIWEKKKYLRIGAIALFGITLSKLFFYDISDLDTIDKTVVFVSLGVLLLIISFLYNKFKYMISGEPEE